MKLLGVFTIITFLGLVGCRKSAEARLRVDAKCGEALMLALVDTQLILLDSPEDIKSVNDFVPYLEKQNKLNHLLPYGLSNICFNPSLTIWKAAALSNRIDSNVIAVIIRKQHRNYSAIYFDARLKAFQSSPVPWCN